MQNAPIFSFGTPAPDNTRPSFFSPEPIVTNVPIFVPPQPVMSNIIRPKPYGPQFGQ
jgi:hypothetical protein